MKRLFTRKSWYLITIGVIAEAWPGLDFESFYLHISKYDLTYERVVKEAESRGIKVERVVAIGEVPAWFRNSNPPKDHPASLQMVEPIKT